MTIIVCPLGDVENCIEQHAPTHLISLRSPGSDPVWLPTGGRQHIELTFNDITEARDGLVAPNAEHVSALLGFLQSWDRQTPLLVHCWAGVSRSTAVAYAIACLREGDADEGIIAARLRACAPFATPNLLLVALFDAALGRHGRMVSAIAQIGRGSEVTQGFPFAI